MQTDVVRSGQPDYLPPKCSGGPHGHLAETPLDSGYWFHTHEEAFEPPDEPHYHDEPLEEQRCAVCGCTDEDCYGCYERTGQPCYWIEEDLCSACVADSAPVDGYRRRPSGLYVPN